MHGCGSIKSDTFGVLSHLQIVVLSRVPSVPANESFDAFSSTTSLKTRYLRDSVVRTALLLPAFDFEGAKKRPVHMRL